MLALRAAGAAAVVADLAPIAGHPARFIQGSGQTGHLGGAAKQILNLSPSTIRHVIGRRPGDRAIGLSSKVRVHIARPRIHNGTQCRAKLGDPHKQPMSLRGMSLREPIGELLF